MAKQMIYKIFGVILLVSVVLMIILNFSTSVKINIGDEKARYYQNTITPETGILVVGDNQNVISSILPMLKQMQSDILVTDSEDLDSSIKKLSDLSGVSYENIDVISIGGSVLSTLTWYNSSDISPNSMVMISPDVDIDYLVGVGLYSCSYFAKETKSLIIQSVTASDESIENSINLYNLLTAETIKPNGMPIRSNKNNVSLIISPGTVISDNPVSVQMLDNLGKWFGTNNNASAILKIKSLLWITTMISLIVVMYWLVKKNTVQAFQIVTTSVPRLWKFYIGRLSIWLLSMPLMLVFYFVLSFFEGSMGIFGKLFTSYVLSCGFTILAMYQFEYMFGVKGVPTDTKFKMNAGAVLYSLTITIIVCTILSILASSGFFGFQLTIKRAIFFLALWAMFTVCMMSINHDAIIIEQVTVKNIQSHVLLLIPYLPLLILPLFAVPMGNIQMMFAMLKCIYVLNIAIMTQRICFNSNKSARLSCMLSAVVIAGYLAFNVYV